MSAKYKTRIMEIMIISNSQRDNGSRLLIEGDGKNELVRVEQDESYIDIYPEEWPALKAGIEKMIKEIKKHEENIK